MIFCENVLRKYLKVEERKFIEFINLASFVPSLKILRAKSISFTSSNRNLQKRGFKPPDPDNTSDVLAPSKGFQSFGNSQCASTHFECYFKANHSQSCVVLLHGEQPGLMTLMLVCLQDGLAMPFPALNYTKISPTGGNMTTRSVNKQSTINQTYTG